MKQLGWLTIGVAVGAVGATKTLEARGVLHCCCPKDCWCHRPVLSAFRWLIPVQHGFPVDHNADHGPYSR